MSAATPPRAMKIPSVGVAKRNSASAPTGGRGASTSVGALMVSLAEEPFDPQPAVESLLRVLLSLPPLPLSPPPPPPPSTPSSPPPLPSPLPPPLPPQPLPGLSAGRGPRGGISTTSATAENTSALATAEPGDAMSITGRSTSYEPVQRPAASWPKRAAPRRAHQDNSVLAKGEGADDLPQWSTGRRLSPTPPLPAHPALTTPT